MNGCMFLNARFVSELYSWSCPPCCERNMSNIRSHFREMLCKMASYCPLRQCWRYVRELRNDNNTVYTRNTKWMCLLCGAIMSHLLTLNKAIVAEEADTEDRAGEESVDISESVSVWNIFHEQESEWTKLIVWCWIVLWLCWHWPPSAPPPWSLIWLV